MIMKNCFFRGMLVMILWTGALSLAWSQVIITNDPSYTTPASGAILDVKATNKGFMPPRVSLTGTTDVSTIPSPATGLLVYNTNASITGGHGTGYYYYNGSAWLSFETGMHYIGESFDGGTVFWLDDSGRHGLISTTSDQSAGTTWNAGTNSFVVGTTGGFGGGESSTFEIIATQRAGTGTVYAARQCAELTVSTGGSQLSGWYLPSISELVIMYQNRTSIGGFSSAIYWSSSQATDTYALGIDFSNGNSSSSAKSSSLHVRCIRKF
jgi:hypothetical protein